MGPSNPLGTGGFRDLEMQNSANNVFLLCQVYILIAKLSFLFLILSLSCKATIVVHSHQLQSFDITRFFVVCDLGMLVNSCPFFTARIEKIFNDSLLLLGAISYHTRIQVILLFSFFAQ